MRRDRAAILDDGVTGEGGLCTAVQDSRGLAPGDSIEYGHQLGLDSYLCAIPLIDFNTFFTVIVGMFILLCFVLKTNTHKVPKSWTLTQP